MKSLKVSVLVYQGRQAVFPSPKDISIRKIPGGYAGVVHDGRVYPLRKDATIDIDDESFVLEECSGPIPFYSEIPPILEKEVVVPQRIRWFCEGTFSGYYLAFDGNPAVKDAVSLELEKGGIGIWKVGPSFRRAVDGHQYDWYIKLQREPTRTAIENIMERASRSLYGEQPVRRKPAQNAHPSSFVSVSELEAALEPEIDWSDVESGCPDTASDIYEEEFISRLDQLWEMAHKYGAPQDDPLARISWIINQTKAWHNEKSSLKRQATEAKDLTARHKKQIVSLEREINSLKIEVGARDKENRLLNVQLRKAQKGQPVGPGPADYTSLTKLEKEKEELKKRLSKKQAEYDEMEELANLAQNKQDELSEALTARENEIERLSAENRSLKSTPGESAVTSEAIAKPIPAGKHRTQEIIQKGFENFLPRFFFHDRTSETIYDHFSEVPKLFSRLYEFHENQKTKGKAIKGTKGWFELPEHIHTGRDDMGRIYFRRRGGTNYYDIYVHYKKDELEQKRLFEEMESWPPFGKD